MASTNQSPEYLAAEKRYLLAGTDEEKLLSLEEMARTMPKHKAGESMRANIRLRIKKLKEKLEEKKKSKKGKEGIKKAELQAVLIGLTNSGKSSILASLTNAKPEITPFPYTTKQALIGTLDFENIKIQIIDLPAIESEYFDQGIVNTSDALLIVIKEIEDIEKISPFLDKAIGKKLIICNKIDLLSEQEKRKIEARLRTKKLNFILFSARTKENLSELKEKIFQSFNKIRIYTKQPGKPADKEPVIMAPGSNVKELADKIFHGLSKQVKETRVTGPSSKFLNQKTGLNHILKDKDIVEFKT